jgi:cell division GTPase FtsZ
MSGNVGKFDLKTIFPANIIVVGAGGGGSRTIIELPKFLFEAYNANLCSMEMGREKTPKVHLVDHDTV